MLSATDITFAYDATPILRGVSLEVPEGGLVGVLGPTRLAYPEAIGTVRFVSGLMNELVDHLYN